MTKDEIITVAKCCIVDNCVSCPLAGHGNCITDFMNHILEYMKTEPAPAATDTSSEILKNINSTHLDDSTKEQICQAYKTADEACEDIIDIYEVMSEREHRAFNIGEVYGKICSTRDKLEKLKGGDGNEH
ncbi:hypothetical protein [Ruminococcus bicirculans (ex Wegman et al. 2014)]|jgi:hypothetical protein|uniref:hypothetical protein n=1 Tax=Ruminococcus bicirculans (ex Wegman et al. 2014) TaxID=1160721 RepID=UPI003FEF69D7